MPPDNSLGCGAKPRFAWLYKTGHENSQNEHTEKALKKKKKHLELLKITKKEGRWFFFSTHLVQTKAVIQALSERRGLAVVNLDHLLLPHDWLIFHWPIIKYSKRTAIGRKSEVQSYTVSVLVASFRGIAKKHKDQDALIKGVGWRVRMQEMT